MIPLTLLVPLQSMADASPRVWKRHVKATTCDAKMCKWIVSMLIVLGEDLSIETRQTFVIQHMNCPVEDWIGSYQVSMNLILSCFRRLESVREWFHSQRASRVSYPKLIDQFVSKYTQTVCDELLDCTPRHELNVHVEFFDALFPSWSQWVVWLSCIDFWLYCSHCPPHVVEWGFRQIPALLPMRERSERLPTLVTSRITVPDK